MGVHSGQAAWECAFMHTGVRSRGRCPLHSGSAREHCGLTFGATFRDVDQDCWLHCTACHIPHLEVRPTPSSHPRAPPTTLCSQGLPLLAHIHEPKPCYLQERVPTTHLGRGPERQHSSLLCLCPWAGPPPCVQLREACLEGVSTRTRAQLRAFCSWQILKPGVYI